LSICFEGVVSLSRAGENDCDAIISSVSLGGLS